MEQFGYNIKCRFVAEALIKDASESQSKKMMDGCYTTVMMAVDYVDEMCKKVGFDKIQSAEIGFNDDFSEFSIDLRRNGVDARVCINIPVKWESVVDE